MVKNLDRDFASRVMRGQPHHLQSSLVWYDFLRQYSKEEDRSVTLYRDGDPVAFFCALQLKDLIQSLPFPASYAGLQVLPTLTASDMTEAYHSLFEHYSSQCNVLSICTGPLFGSTADAVDFDFQLEGTVHALDLTDEPLARTTSKFRNNLQRNLRKAENAGVQVKLTNEMAKLKQWYHCYSKRMSELKGTQLPFGYFESMFRELEPTGNCSLVTAEVDQDFLGGIVTVQNEHCLDYYLSMFNREDDETQASTAAFYFLVKHAKAQGIKFMNLQASPKSQPDLVRFKKSWGATEYRHKYLVKVLNNADAILNQSAEHLSKEYPFHFVVPFSALKAEPVLA